MSRRSGFLTTVALLGGLTLLTITNSAYAQREMPPSRAVSATDSVVIGREVPKLTVNPLRLRELRLIGDRFSKSRLEKIADSIEGQLKGRCVGYSFVVGYNNSPAMTVARAGGRGTPCARQLPAGDEHRGSDHDR